MVRVIQTGGRKPLGENTPFTLSFNYRPSRTGIEGGAVNEHFEITPEGVEMSKDAARSALSMYPHDIRIVEDVQAVVADDVAPETAETAEGTANGGTALLKGQIAIASLGGRELQTVARIKGIAGRSSMNKAELIAALS